MGPYRYVSGPLHVGILEMAAQTLPLRLCVAILEYTFMAGPSTSGPYLASCPGGKYFKYS